MLASPTRRNLENLLTIPGVGKILTMTLTMAEGAGMDASGRYDPEEGNGRGVSRKRTKKQNTKI